MGAMPPGLGPILCVVGARPNYMKMAPLLAAFGGNARLPRAVLVHTGQHYDAALNDRLFVDLQLPRPDLNLEVGSGSHATQTAEVMRRFEPVLDRYDPCAVVVVGDVNSTLACSLVAVKKAVPVVHVEAGLRSFDRSMPEEVNRLLTDQISDLLYTTERSAAANLAREGIPAERIAFVGNVMIDSLRTNLPRAVPPAETLRRAGKEDFLRLLGGGQAGGFRYGVVTLHRPSNVDRPEALLESLELLRAVSDRLPLVCPLHPRTRQNVERFGMESLLTTPRIADLPPQGYLEMLGLMATAAVVLTDSGGVQEETTALGVPCLTMRDNTERPITVEEGTNVIVGRDRALALRLLDEIVAGGGKRGRSPELWDGHASERIANHLAGWLARRQVPVGA
ncbi:MAG: non-hydrolyzing UDP-N-acetylglucosamine 2-epimerase [Burkholderiales bacterium]